MRLPLGKVEVSGGIRSGSWEWNRGLVVPKALGIGVLLKVVEHGRLEQRSAVLLSGQYYNTNVEISYPIILFFFSYHII